MQIKLEYDETKEALTKVMNDKTGHIFGVIDSDDCYFEIVDVDGNEIITDTMLFSTEVV